jgi:hypothetical protein
VKPTIGRIVWYTLTSQDAEEINRRRRDAEGFRRSAMNGPPSEAGGPGRSGHVEHHGNDAGAGDEYPAMVVRVFDPAATAVNLQVHLDGNDTFWATSRMEGDGPGTWAWPVIAREPGDRPPRY